MQTTLKSDSLIPETSVRDLAFILFKRKWSVLAILVMTMVGASITPFWFQFFDRVSRTIDYRDMGETSFRTDRDIKRGRS